MEKNKFTRLTVEQSDKKITWEVPYEDVDGELMVDAFKTLLVGMTFSPNSVPHIFANWLMSNAYDLYDIYEKEQKVEENDND